MYLKIFKLALLGYAGVLLYAGWMPLTIRPDAAAVRQELREAVAGAPAQWPGALRGSDGQKNLLLFVPLGGLAALVLHGRRRTWALLAMAAAAAAAISLTIEAGQLVIPERYARAQDVAFNLAGGALGAAAAALAVRPGRAAIRRLLPVLRNRHALLAAALLAAALVACTAWRVRLDPALAAHQWQHGMTWSVSDALAGQAWHEWLVRRIGPYAALTLLLAAATACPEIRRRRALAMAGVATALAAGVEALRLLVPGEAPDLAAPLLVAPAAAAMALLAPALHRRQVSLRTGVLMTAVGLIVLLAYLSWSSSGPTRWPLWGLYSHEYAWAYYSSLRRWAVVATVSLLLAFYVSLRCPWRLRHRMVAGVLAAVGCAAGLEAAKALLGPRGGSIANLLEHVLAALLGSLLFALAWRILDRRGRGERRLAVRAESDRRKRE